MNDNHQQIEQLRQMVDKANKIVFFGGAGVSTESGIKDFRSADGLYSQKFKYPPEYMLSHTCFVRHTEDFFQFYRDKLLQEGILPNAAHYKLAELEKSGKLSAVVTQNIDGLHQAAGSKLVYELHGSTLRNYCEKCHAFYDDNFIRSCTGVPLCTKCGGVVKPDVVLYEEGLDGKTIEGAVRAISECDLLIVAGTSLSVYPASSLIYYKKPSAKLVIINLQPTQADSGADLVIADKVGVTLAQL